MENVICGTCDAAVSGERRSCPICGSALPRRRPAPQAPGPADPTQAPPTYNRDPFAPKPVRATVGFSGSRKIVLDRGDRLVVGRSPDSPVADLCSDNISRLHAEIYVSEKGAFVLDVGSTNGTFVEGERLAARSPWLVTSTAAVAFGADPPLRLTIEVEEVE